MLYFAYGSNMSTLRLQNRLPASVVRGTGVLQGYQLAFDKISTNDGSGKCNIQFTGDKLDGVCGVLYELPDADLVKLDEIEGEGHGYARKSLYISQEGTGLVAAESYLATKTDASLKPMHWYKEHVLWGAHEHKFPDHYIEFIESVSAIIDYDPERAARERSIYR